jgi:hypothetical protein
MGTMDETNAMQGTPPQWGRLQQFRTPSRIRVRDGELAMLAAGQINLAP